MCLFQFWFPQGICLWVGILGHHTFILYICVSFWFAIKIVYTIFVDSTYMHQNMIFSFSNLLHCVLQSLGPSTSLQMAHFGCSLWLNNISLYLIFFIHSSIDGHLGYFHVLVVVNCASVNTWVHVPFWIMVFFHIICPGVEILGEMVVLFLVF